MFRILTAAFMLLSFAAQEIELDAPKQGPSVSTYRIAWILPDWKANEALIVLQAWDSLAENWQVCEDICTVQIKLRDDPASDFLLWYAQANYSNPQKHMRSKVMRYLQDKGFITEPGTVVDEPAVAVPEAAPK